MPVQQGLEDTLGVQPDLGVDGRQHQLEQLPEEGVREDGGQLGGLWEDGKMIKKCGGLNKTLKFVSYFFKFIILLSIKILIYLIIKKIIYFLN